MPNFGICRSPSLRSDPVLCKRSIKRRALGMACHIDKLGGQSNLVELHQIAIGVDGICGGKMKIETGGYNALIK